MYGLIKNGVLMQKQEEQAKGFIVIGSDTVCGQVTTDGGKTFTNPVPTPIPYTHLRATAYPPMTDYLDAIVKGDSVAQNTYIASCLAVKAEYPK